MASKIFSCIEETMLSCIFIVLTGSCFFYCEKLHISERLWATFWETKKVKTILFKTYCTWGEAWFIFIFLRTLKFAYFCFVKNLTKILLSWSVFVFYSLIFVYFCVRKKKPSKLHPMKLVKNTRYYERTFWRLKKSMFFTYFYRVF